MTIRCEFKLAPWSFYIPGSAHLLLVSSLNSSPNELEFTDQSDAAD